MSALTDQLAGFTRFLFPTRCSLCRKFTPHAICLSCFQQIPWLSWHRGKERKCALMAYTGMARRMIYYFKYGDHHRIRDFLVSLLVAGYRSKASGLATLGISGVVPIPPRYGALEDHTTFLAQEVARHLGLPYCAYLMRPYFTFPQHRLPAALRKKCFYPPFQVREEANAELPGKTLLLIDDVATTGSTLSRAIELLSQAGAREVYALTLAQTPKLK